MKKTAILLVNLGSPREPNKKKVRIYLKQFLSDRRIIDIPQIIWWFILNLFILPIRAKKSANLYKKVWTKNGSPLIVNSKKQQQKLQLEFKDMIVELAMRYGSPSIDYALTRLGKININKIIVIPLYPQFSSSTTASVFDAISEYYKNMQNIPNISFVSDYHQNSKYIASLALKIKDSWTKNKKADILLISFHGTPLSFREKGDPYYEQCIKTAKLLADKLDLTTKQYKIVFQSQFGNREWLQPYAVDVLKQLASENKSVDIICPGFASDCLETLEEINISYRNLFIKSGGKSFNYIEALNDDSNHIKMLKNIVEENV